MYIKPGISGDHPLEKVIWEWSQHRSRANWWGERLPTTSSKDLDPAMLEVQFISAFLFCFSVTWVNKIPFLSSQYELHFMSLVAVTQHLTLYIINDVSRFTQSLVTHLALVPSLPSSPRLFYTTSSCFLLFLGLYHLLLYLPQLPY